MAIVDPPELERRAKPMSVHEKKAAGQTKSTGGDLTATPTPKIWREIGSPARTPSNRPADASSEELPPFLSPALNKQQSFLLNSPALRSMQRSLDQAADEVICLVEIYHFVLDCSIVCGCRSRRARNFLSTN